MQIDCHTKEMPVMKLYLTTRIFRKKRSENDLDLKFRFSADPSRHSQRSVVIDSTEKDRAQLGRLKLP